jgi:hypothetical protein
MANKTNKNTGSVTLPKIPSPNQHNETGVVQTVGDSQIPHKLLSPGWDLHEAGVMTRLVDENQVNDVTRLFDWLKEFQVEEGLETLRFWLNLKRSVEGRASIWALMGHTQILSPTALGIKLSKEESRNLEDIQRGRKQQQDKDQHSG